MSLALALVLTQLTAKKPDWWELKVRYPRFKTPGAVARAANAASSARERKVFRDFLAEARRDMPGLKKEGSAGTYQLETTPHVTADRAGVCSGYVERYDYLAGAHGTTRYEVLNYGVLRGRAQAFTLKDVFRRGEDAVGQTSRAIAAAFKREPEVPSMIESGEWKILTERQSHRFVVGKLGLLFLFNQYELGSGAEGARSVLVRYRDLPGLDRGGALKGLVP